jgi:hypothetical protein
MLSPGRSVCSDHSRRGYVRRQSPFPPTGGAPGKSIDLRIMSIISLRWILCRQSSVHNILFSGLWSWRCGRLWARAGLLWTCRITTTTFVRRASTEQCEAVHRLEFISIVSRRSHRGPVTYGTLAHVGVCLFPGLSGAISPSTCCPPLMQGQPPCGYPNR